MNIVRNALSVPSRAGLSTSGLLGAALGVFLVISPASAGTILAEGEVMIISDSTTFASDAPTAKFDEGQRRGPIETTQYEGSALTFQTGQFSEFFPGIVSQGFVSKPKYISRPNAFSGLVESGVIAGSQCQYCGVATFSKPVSRVGLIASQNGTQYLTAWDPAGALIGQVRWIPEQDSGFIGLDAGNRLIAMVAYGNDNLYAGKFYDILGDTTWSDNWVWEVRCNHNGIIDSSEECDDGNTENGDGCSDLCIKEAVGCGNNIVESPEACDDGNTEGADGCSADCRSKEICGNGYIDSAIGETCDDGNTEDGDGCSASCTVETEVRIVETPSEFGVSGGGCNSSNSPKGGLLAFALIGLALGFSTRGKSNLARR